MKGSRNILIGKRVSIETNKIDFIASGADTELFGFRIQGAAVPFYEEYKGIVIDEDDRHIELEVKGFFGPKKIMLNKYNIVKMRVLN